MIREKSLLWHLLKRNRSRLVIRGFPKRFRTAVINPGLVPDGVV
jgi:hypothetical protein